MVCKEDFLQWFKSLSSYKRIDIMNSLFNMCVPFEIRFLGSNLEEKAKHDYIAFIPCEKMANSLIELKNDLPTNSSGIFDIQIRHKLTLYISLLSSNNYQCATWIYSNFLKNSNWLDLFSNSIASVAELFDELLLLYVLAYYHPAFKFEDKLDIARIILRLEEDYNKHFTKMNSASDLFFNFNPQSQSTSTPNSNNFVNHSRYPFHNVNFIKTAVINHISPNNVIQNELPNPLPPPGLNYPNTSVVAMGNGGGSRSTTAPIAIAATAANEVLSSTMSDQQQVQMQSQIQPQPQPHQLKNFSHIQLNPHDQMWNASPSNSLSNEQIILQNSNYREQSQNSNNNVPCSSPSLTDHTSASTSPCQSPDNFYLDKFSYQPTQMHPGHFPHPTIPQQSQQQIQHHISSQIPQQARPSVSSRNNDNNNSVIIENQNDDDKTRISGWVETGYPAMNTVQYMPNIQSLKIDDNNSIQSTRSNSPDSNCTESVTTSASSIVPTTNTPAAIPSTTSSSIINKSNTQKIPLHAPGRGQIRTKHHDCTNSMTGPQNTEMMPPPPQMPHPQVMYTNCVNMPYTTPCIQSHVFPSRTILAYPTVPNSNTHGRTHYIVQSNNEIIFPISNSSNYIPVMYAPNVIPPQPQPQQQHPQPIIPHKTNCWNCGSDSHLAHDCKENFSDQSTSAPRYQLNYSAVAKTEK